MRTIEEIRKEIHETDRQMARLFENRMKAVMEIAACKKARGLPVLDEVQEKRVLANNAELIQNELIRPYYLTFMKEVMAISRSFQESLIGDADFTPNEEKQQ